MRSIFLTTTAAAILCAGSAYADVVIGGTIVYGDDQADETYDLFGTPVTDGDLGEVDLIDADSFEVGQDSRGDIQFDLFGGADLKILEWSFESDDPDFDAIWQIGGFARDEVGAPVFLNEGDVVDFSTGTFDTAPIDLYGEGGLAQTGDSGIFGFTIDLIGLTEPVDAAPEDLFEGYCVELPWDCEQSETFASFYGWVQVERGSVIPGYIGINPLGGGALVTLPSTTPPPPVPLPAAGWLLLAGVGGLVAMKRRSRTAA